MFQFLLELLFSWLPSSLWVCVCAVLGTMFFIVLIKFLGIILEWVFKFIDIFT